MLPVYQKHRFKVCIEKFKLGSECVLLRKALETAVSCLSNPTFSSTQIFMAFNPKNKRRGQHPGPVRIKRMHNGRISTWKDESSDWDCALTPSQVHNNEGLVLSFQFYMKKKKRGVELYLFRNMKREKNRFRKCWHLPLETTQPSKWDTLLLFDGW